MCDFFWQRLETADQGDLADIVRASGGGGGGGSISTGGASSGPSSSTVGVDSWQQQQQQLHIDQPAAAAASAAVAAFPPLPVDDFSCGAPLFGSLRDPLLHELAGTGGFFDGPTDGGSQGCGGDILAAQEMQMFADEVKRPCSNLFSRVLQISPSSKPLLQLSPGAINPPPPPPPPPPPTIVADRSMQISSPCTPGIKRRKSQAKKVVCIPAPAAASNRPSGEVVPSDLWAWRKYGQKPIKGSPYPRGYYRCSSSKGCSARKQVERSRTDPNMLVITYTSEHNHPWPTQRNALAGSTRSQPTKNGGASASKNSGHQNQRMANSNMKEEPNDQSATASSSLVVVKEETVGSDTEKVAVEASAAGDRAFDQMLYGEAAMDHGSSLTSDDFFSDLAELDPDPMSLIFPGTDRGQEELKNKSKALDSFIDIFDWGGSSFGDQYQAKKGL